MVECKNESQKIPEGISNIEVDEEVDAILVIESSSAYSKLSAKLDHRENLC